MGQKAVTRNRTGNPAQLSCVRTTNVKASCSAVTANQPNPVSRLGPKGHGGRTAQRRPWVRGCRPPAEFTPPSLPARSAVLTAAANGSRERSNPSLPLHDGAAGQAHGSEGKDWPRSQGPRESRGIRRRGHTGTRGRAARGAQHHEHTGNGSAGMAGPPLAQAGAERPQAPRADLPSFAAGRDKESPAPATSAVEFLVGQVPGRPQGHPGQPGQEDSRCRWRRCPRPRGATVPGCQGERITVSPKYQPLRISSRR